MEVGKRGDGRGGYPLEHVIVFSSSSIMDSAQWESWIYHITGFVILVCKNSMILII